MLYDAGNKVAESYGLVFSLSDTLKEVYKNFGIDLEASNGDGTWSLPLPATYVIRQDGTVAYHFADADYTKRLDPEKVIEALKGLTS